MVVGKKLFVGFKIPFTLQIAESLKSMQYIIKVDTLDFSTKPRDY